MTDYDPASINACKHLWPQVKPLYCYFHFMQLVTKHCRSYGTTGETKLLNYLKILKFVRECHYSKSANDHFIKWKWGEVSQLRLDCRKKGWIVLKKVGL
jgi:hypothetical protein